MVAIFDSHEVMKCCFDNPTATNETLAEAGDVFLHYMRQKSSLSSTVIARQAAV